jgi:hypothetical protein
VGRRGIVGLVPVEYVQIVIPVAALVFGVVEGLVFGGILEFIHRWAVLAQVGEDGIDVALRDEGVDVDLHLREEFARGGG